MELRIYVDGGGPAADVRSLLTWLRQDTALRGVVDLVPASPRSGEMGALGDVLSVALGPAGTGVALAGALSIWLRSRTSDVKVTVASERGKVTIDVRRAKDPSKVLEDLERIADDVA